MPREEQDGPTRGHPSRPGGMFRCLPPSCCWGDVEVLSFCVCQGQLLLLLGLMEGLGAAAAASMCTCGFVAIGRRPHMLCCAAAKERRSPAQAWTAHDNTTAAIKGLIPGWLLGCPWCVHQLMCIHVLHSSAVGKQRSPSVRERSGTRRGRGRGRGLGCWLLLLVVVAV